MKTNFTNSFKKALLLPALIVLVTTVKSQTYTTIANGNWNSPTTWQSGLVPASGVILATAVININHNVTYTNTYLENYGVINIVNTTGLNPQLLVPANVTFNNYITGRLFIKDGLYTQYRFTGGGNTGTAQNGNFINLGGRVQIVNSIVEVAQDWENKFGISSFTNGSLTTGQNYITSATAIDSLSGVSLSLGWHGSGDFKASNSINYLQNARIQVASTSGNFKINESTSISGDIDYITFKNHVTNVTSNGIIEFTNSVIVLGSLNVDAYCTVSTANYDTKGKCSGPQLLNCSLNYFPVNYTIASTAVLTNGLQFSNPVLVSGVALQPGAVYSFKTIAPGVDATVKIDSLINGAEVTNIDDNAASVGYSNAFQPVIKSGNVVGRSYAVFTFNFYQANTSSPLPLNIVKASALDIDGGATLKEYADIKMGVGASAIYLNNTSDISISSLGAGTFRGENILGIERSGIDTASYANMVTATNQNISSFSISYGTLTSVPSTSARQFSLYMKGFMFANQAILPVKYSSFTASTAGNLVNLQWVTQTEINNSHFEIERSSDGVNFKKIGVVVTNGTINGNTAKAYNYTDNGINISDAVVYYRLKQVDFDGRYAYSNTLVVRLQALSGIKMQVMPNPFIENLTVSFEAAAKATAQLQIVNTQGQLILLQNTSVNKGNNSIQVIGLNKLAPGTYIARLYTNGEVAATQKIIKN